MSGGKSETGQVGFFRYFFDFCRGADAQPCERFPVHTPHSPTRPRFRVSSLSRTRTERARRPEALKEVEGRSGFISPLVAPTPHLFRHHRPCPHPHPHPYPSLSSSATCTLLSPTLLCFTYHGHQLLRLDTRLIIAGIERRKRSEAILSVIRFRKLDSTSARPQ